MRIKNIIFDFDGTVIDSSKDVVRSFRQAYKLEGILNVNLKKIIIGPPVKKIIRALTPDIPPKKAIAVGLNFRKIYDSGTFSKTKLFRGVNKLFRQLRRRKIKLFLATNKPILPTKKDTQKT